ncbi:hypothetical protein BCR42DRAFT_478519 [Absidia repens]|uniref:Uncharacterized protein n=1 Tax=Absidia repens TaxID=90262 RepID=A0A1X2IK59_9FUNG|nr:hypothetical protein BCR42DRAFT_478519 [Absidia repens]
MQIHLFLPVLVSGCIFFAHQVSAVYLVNWWQTPKNFGSIKEMISSMRVPPGSDPTHTYWCANGFTRGYLGMQHNDGTDRRFLFSIWDDGKGSKVDALQINPDAEDSTFGGEGTGSHTILHHPWNAGDVIFFRLTAEPNQAGDYTDFAGYYRFGDTGSWTLIAKYRAEKTVLYLTGAYSFLENFAGTDKNVLREGFYGNQTMININDKDARVQMSYESQRVTKGDIWEQRLVNGESYVRMDGLKDQGIYPPTNNS